MHKNVVIIGALGKDFHTFNRVYKNDPVSTVVAFTFAGEQNVGTTEEKSRDLRYPSELAGSKYPDGIPLLPESKLEEIIKTYKVDEVVFSYSDVSHEELMHKASRALAAGADFRLVTPARTQIKANKPVVAVCAVRTGCGKSQVSRVACRYFRDMGLRVVAIREPMPYGNLVKQNIMRFAKYEDFEKYDTTMEEREEYEPYVEQGLVVYSGVDYKAILDRAEAEADVIVWDGGNNEVSFYVPDLLFVVCDALRPGCELKYHPGEVNVRSADVFVINKVNAAADPEAVGLVVKNLRAANARADIIKTNSDVLCDKDAQKLIKGKRCLVVEDGPTTTHGNMSFGAGYAAAKKYGGIIVPPPISAMQGSMRVIFEDFPHLKEVIPAMGYTEKQRNELVASINAVPNYDVIVNGSPLHLQRLLPGLKKPVARVTYDIKDFKEGPTVTSKMEAFTSKFALL